MSQQDWLTPSCFSQTPLQTSLRAFKIPLSPALPQHVFPLPASFHITFPFRFLLSHPLTIFLTQLSPTSPFSPHHMPLRLPTSPVPAGTPHVARALPAPLGCPPTSPHPNLPCTRLPPCPHSRAGLGPAPPAAGCPAAGPTQAHPTQPHAAIPALPGLLWMPVCSVRQGSQATGTSVIYTWLKQIPRWLHSFPCILFSLPGLGGHFPFLPAFSLPVRLISFF